MKSLKNINIKLEKTSYLKLLIQNLFLIK